MSEVAQMEDDAVIRHGFPPATDELGIHLFGIPERPVAVSDDVLMAEVGVRGEPDFLRGEFVDLVGHVYNFFCKVRPLE